MRRTRTTPSSKWYASITSPWGMLLLLIVVFGGVYWWVTSHHFSENEELDTLRQDVPLRAESKRESVGQDSSFADDAISLPPSVTKQTASVGEEETGKPKQRVVITSDMVEALLEKEDSQASTESKRAE